MPYVSVTGLKLKGQLHAPRFWWHAIRSMAQAQKADGNLRASARAINGINFTVTQWEDRAAMRRFMISGAHAQAMRAFPAIATGKTFGFESDMVPAWDEIYALWIERGNDYAAAR
ncbi:MAG: hypothetical protein ACKVOB_11360 [Sphingomonas sp.]